MPKKINARNKGASGERWVVNFFKNRFPWLENIRREALAQSSDPGSAPDVLLPSLWVEVKYTDYVRSNPKKAYEQAFDASSETRKRMAKNNEFLAPIAICRTTRAPKGGGHVTVTVGLDDFCVMYESLLLRAGVLEDKSKEVCKCQDRE